VVSQQVKDAIPVGSHCMPERCPYYEEGSGCLVMGEEIKPEYKICGINEVYHGNVRLCNSGVSASRQCP
jgi:hypothetical protein